MTYAQHVFGDHARARKALTEYRDYLVSRPPADFADAVLDVIKAFEREKPIRRVMRERMPHGTAGYVPEDLDLVLRLFGSRYATDAMGKLRLVETKFNPRAEAPVRLKGGQLHTFRLLDAMLRSSQMHDRYDGFYVVTHSDFNLLDGRFWLSQLGEPTEQHPIEVCSNDFMRWLAGEIHASELAQNDLLLRETPALPLQPASAGGSAGTTQAQSA